jgi:hypothetical protein
MLYLNVFPDGVLVEFVPNGDRSTPIRLDERAEACAREMLSRSPAAVEISYSLARVFLAGAQAGERAVRTGPGKANPQS